MSFEPPQLGTSSTDVLSKNSLAPALEEGSLTNSLTGLGRSNQSLLFVDKSVTDYEQLLAGVTTGTEIHVLDPGQDAVTQITNTLLGRQNIASLHIVSHGEAGGVDFGSSTLNLTDLPQYAAQLKTWSKALINDGDILFYGCNVAEGQLGQAFVQNISQVTGADVAASDDLTGSTTLGGDWNLEFNTGNIETVSAFNSSATADFNHVLASLVNGLGGTAGFGENTGPIEDDASVEVSLTSVLSSGVNFFGTTYTSVFLNTNGNLTFGSGDESFTPTAITGNSGRPIIAAFFTDIDVRKANGGVTPGGTSTGSNRIYYDFDTTNNIVTFTWDDVAPFTRSAASTAFQIRLIKQGSTDFDLEYRYEGVNWTNGNNGIAVAGWSAANGVNYYQLPQSGNDSQISTLPSASNVSQAGIFR